MKTERTLILFKPDAIQRGLVGEIMQRFERVGLKMVATKMVQPNEDHYHEHYEGISQMISRRGKDAFDVTMALMTAGPVIAVVLEGVEAISQVRKMVGETEPKSAQPGSIRGDYSHTSFAYADGNKKGIANLIHAAGDEKEAKAEISHWFKGDEIYDYRVLHEGFTH